VGPSPQQMARVLYVGGKGLERMENEDPPKALPLPEIGEHEAHAEINITGVASKACLYKADRVMTTVIDERGVKLRLSMSTPTAERVQEAIRHGLNDVFNMRTQHGSALNTIPEPAMMINSTGLEIGIHPETGVIIVRVLSQNSPPVIVTLSEKSAQTLAKTLPKAILEGNQIRKAPRN
jgi:hypothetical protein